MKFTWILVVLMIASLLLGACGGQSAAPGKPAATGDVATKPVTYPGPQATLAGSITSGAYPAPEGGEKISWEEAKTMILNGEVSRIMQAHTKEVTLFIKDGRVLVTVEPNIDDVLTVVEQCGDLCKETTVITE